MELFELFEYPSLNYGIEESLNEIARILDGRGKKYIKEKKKKKKGYEILKRKKIRKRVFGTMSRNTGRDSSI